jgi:hypothetical protein
MGRACMAYGENGMCTGFWWEIKNGSQINRRVGMDLINLAQDRDQGRVRLNTVDPKGSMKCWEIFEQLSKWWLLVRDSAAWSLFCFNLG